MIRVSFTNTNQVYDCSDINTLQDIATGHGCNEAEAERLAAIAGNMKLGDFYSTDTCCMYCEEIRKARAF